MHRLMNRRIGGSATPNRPILTFTPTWKEQADQKRELARQAAEQAKAMNAQADQLEGKASTKKKESR